MAYIFFLIKAKMEKYFPLCVKCHYYMSQEQLVAKSPVWRGELLSENEAHRQREKLRCWRICLRLCLLFLRLHFLLLLSQITTNLVAWNGLRENLFSCLLQLPERAHIPCLLTFLHLWSQQWLVKSFSLRFLCFCLSFLHGKTLVITLGLLGWSRIIFLY